MRTPEGWAKRCRVESGGRQCTAAVGHIGPHRFDGPTDRDVSEALWTVRYSVGTYSGEVVVVADADAEAEHVIARARRIVTHRAGGSLPFGAESWRVVDGPV